MERKDVLEGVRVVDFTWIVAGPQGTRILADFGAEVIKIENEQTLDSVRLGAPMAGGEKGVNRAALWNYFNRSKKSVTLNVRHPRGLELVKKLISISDVVVENFGSRVLESWGLDYEEMCRLRPDVVYLSCSGFGHSGPLRDYSTWGPTSQALSGLTLMSGLPGHPPAGFGYSYMDHTAGYYAAMAILMALHYRNRTGQGQYIDLSQTEAGIACTGPAVLDFSVNGRRYRRPDYPVGNRSLHPAVAPHNTYRCKGEDRWCVITIFNEQEWRAFCEAIGSPSWTHDSRFATNSRRVENQDELDCHIEEWTRDRTPEEVFIILQKAGVTAGAVQNARDRVEYDPQLRARDFFPTVDNPEFGPHKVDGVPTHLSRSPGYVHSHAPLLGQDNEYVFGELLGCSPEELDELKAEGVI